MATNKLYSDEDVQKAINAIESGRTPSWASMRYGIPVSSLKRKHRQFKQEKDDEEATT